MVFLATEACNKPATQINCYDLVSLDFEKALESPQNPSLMLQCQNSTVSKPIWLNNNDVVLLQKESNRWKLINYSISNNKSTDLFEIQEGNLFDFAYSVSEDLIAVMSVHNDGQHYIEMLKPDGRVLSSHLIEYPQEIPKSRPLYPNFDPINKQLIFSTGRQLFTLSYDGKIAKISSSFADKVGQPEFHSDGKKLLMIKGPYDSDIVLLPLNQITEANPLTQQTQLKQPYSSFERTNLGESHAIFQPGGELNAFWSERSGEEQLWISDGVSPQQLTQFPIDTYIRGIDWAADGKSLLVSANDVLTQVFLDSRQKPFPMEYPVIRLYQWDSKNNSALLLLRIKGLYKFVEYDLNNSEYREINDKIVIWALKSEDGRLIYKDHLGQFWQPGPVEDQRIEALKNQPSKAKSFVIKDNVIYAINTENRVWSYDLTNDTFKVLGEVSKGVDYLTDVNQTQLLMTVQVAAKKEVVELSISE
jgi:transcriptional activator of cad operon